MTGRAAAALAAGWLLVGCAAAPRTGSQERATAARPTSLDRRLMATLRAGNEALWRQVADEIAAMHGAGLVASWFMRSLGEQCLVLETPPRITPGELAERLRHHPRVSGAAPVVRYRVLESAAADPYAHLQQFAGRLRLDAAHRLATGRGITVALIDTGLDLEHPELRGRVTRASDFVGGGGGFTSDVHGTAVAGVVAASGGNGVGIVGVAPDAQLWALKACWQNEPDSAAAVCDSYTLSQALDAAVVGEVDVINLSLAGAPDAVVERLVREALARGIVVVAAAEGDPVSFPASIAGVLAVHSWNDAGPIRPDHPPLPAGALVAPGVDVLTTVPRGGFDFLSGSSFAAAQASGVVALVLEAHPGLSTSEVGDLLRASAPAAAGEPGGARLLDACGAVARARGTTCDAGASP